MRLGFITTQNLAGGPALAIRINDPGSYIPAWAARALDFLSYRIVAADVNVQPLDSLTAGELSNPNLTYAAVLQETVSPPPVPASAAAVLELPNSRLMPFNTANPRSTGRFRWRCRDLNALIYGPPASAPPASHVNLFVQMGGTPNGIAKADISGWVDVEFRGIATL